jgi:hypothetical protein
LKVANRKTAFQNENKIKDNFETLSFGFQIKTDVGRRAFLHFYRFDAKTEKSEKTKTSSSIDKYVFRRERAFFLYVDKHVHSLLSFFLSFFLSCLLASPN